ncbi:MAG: hemin ABC transporter substrate-binding protein [Leptospirales bacterium]|nr:hemin ABC transporter substrate-binding protein [Leptospirales bacterium]
MDLLHRITSTRSRFKRLGVFAGLVALPLVSFLQAAPNAQRIVSVNGPITEILYSLGVGDSIVGTDTTSVFPPAAANTRKVGYQRSLSAEGVLSLKPSLILGTEDAGPPPVIEQIRSAGVSVSILREVHSVDGVADKIEKVGAIVGRDARAKELVALFKTRMDSLQASIGKSALKRKPRILFVYGRGPGSVFIAGRETAVDSLIGLAGGENVMKSFTGFKPLTAEAIAGANPDMILTPLRSSESFGGNAGLLGLPGISLTRAGRESRIFRMEDSLLLALGIRLPEAVETLHRELKRIPQ